VSSLGDKVFSNGALAMLAPNFIKLAEVAVACAWHLYREFLLFFKQIYNSIFLNNSLNFLGGAPV
jgi:hypothetical protein